MTYGCDPEATTGHPTRAGKTDLLDQMRHGERRSPHARGEVRIVRYNTRADHSGRPTRAQKPGTFSSGLARPQECTLITQ